MAGARYRRFVDGPADRPAPRWPALAPRPTARPGTPGPEEHLLDIADPRTAHLDVSIEPGNPLVARVVVHRHLAEAWKYSSAALAPEDKGVAPIDDRHLAMIPLLEGSRSTLRGEPIGLTATASMFGSVGSDRSRGLRATTGFETANVLLNRSLSWLVDSDRDRLNEGSFQGSPSVISTARRHAFAKEAESDMPS